MGSTTLILKVKFISLYIYIIKVNKKIDIINISIKNLISKTRRSIMKLENLKISFNAKANNNNEVNVNFEIGALTLDPQEHADEMKLME